METFQETILATTPETRVVTLEDRCSINQLGIHKTRWGTPNIRQTQGTIETQAKSTNAKLRKSLKKAGR